MSFSSNVREELARVEIPSQCCALAETGAAILGSGGLSFRGKDRYGLAIRTESAAVARRYFLCFKRYFNATCEIRAIKTNRLGERTRYELTPKEQEIPGILSALDLTDEHSLFGLRASLLNSFLTNPCCRAAYLRGLFLGCGTVSNPEKSYQLEFLVREEALKDQAVAVLRALDLRAGSALRKEQWVVYLKDAEAVSSLLGHMGAHKALTDLESVRVMKEIRNDVNRQVNCDNNNMDKTLRASEKQITAIRRIEQNGDFDALPASLKELASLRVEYPNLTLKELGELFDPPLGKSGVNARMRRLEQIAGEFGIRN